MFALQVTDWCSYGKNIKYNKYGEATNCANGLGGSWANSVYRIIYNPISEDPIRPNSNVWTNTILSTSDVK